MDANENMGVDDVAKVANLTIESDEGAHGGAVAEPRLRWPLINRQLLLRHYKKRHPADGKGGTRDERRVLTDKEEEDLVKVLFVAHDRKEGKDHKEIRRLIADALKLRRRQLNKHSGSYRKHTEPLTKAALKVLDSGEALPSDKWFRKFYARHPGLNETGAVTDDAARVDAVSEETAHRHIKSLADESMTLPTPHSVNVPAESVATLLGALALQDKDVIPEAKQHTCVKPMLPPESFASLTEYGLDLSGTTNPVWLYRVDGNFIHKAADIPQLIAKLRESIDDDESTDTTLQLTFNERCDYEGAVFNPLLPSLRTADKFGQRDQAVLPRPGET